VGEKRFIIFYRERREKAKACRKNNFTAEAQRTQRKGQNRREKVKAERKQEGVGNADSPSAAAPQPKKKKKRGITNDTNTTNETNGRTSELRILRQAQNKFT
jgi:hypothetical protein